MPALTKRSALSLSAGLTFLFALWGGLLRVQWALPAPSANWISFHGPLMVGGFFGTIISLARGKTLGGAWPMLVPLASALGAWTFILGGPEKIGSWCFLAASLGYLFISLLLFRKQGHFYSGLALAGAVTWFWSNVMWISGHEIISVMIGWQVLFVLTIASERLEAIRWQSGGLPGLVIWVSVLFILAGALVQPFVSDIGFHLTSAGYLGLALALLVWDAFKSVEKTEGWRGFTRLCLFSGYGWLIVTALLGLFFTPVTTGFFYDAFLHSLFVGLVFSMVFSHAPLLLPRVLKTGIPFEPVFYSHWFLLQLSVALRVAGDLTASTPLRKWGALLNAAALLLFVFNTIRSIRNASSQRSGLSNNKT